MCRRQHELSIDPWRSSPMTLADYYYSSTSCQGATGSYQLPPSTYLSSFNTSVSLQHDLRQRALNCLEACQESKWTLAIESVHQASYYYWGCCCYCFWLDLSRRMLLRRRVRHYSYGLLDRYESCLGCHHWSYFSDNFDCSSIDDSCFCLKHANC